MSLQYDDEKQRMITDAEWRVVLRLRQCRRAWVDMDAQTLNASQSRTEILGPRTATATAPFALPIDTRG